jgi:hypothetical protein
MLDGCAQAAARRTSRALPQLVARRVGAPPNYGSGQSQRRVTLAGFAPQPHPGGCAVQIAKRGASANLHHAGTARPQVRRVQPLGIVAQHACSTKEKELQGQRT